METSKLIKLDLPEFVFLDDSPHCGDTLRKRYVIMHVRTATVMEMFYREDTFLRSDVLTFNFTNQTRFGGVKEKMVCSVHFSATLDIKDDREMLIEKVMKPACKWFCDYLDWEDKNIEDDICF